MITARFCSDIQAVSGQRPLPLSAWICQGSSRVRVRGLHLSAGLPEGRTADYPSREGEEYVLDFPFEVNGFEYQIREVNRCVLLGMSSSDVLKKEDTLDILRLMDDIRASWGLVFDCEK